MLKVGVPAEKCKNVGTWSIKGQSHKNKLKSIKNKQEFSFGWSVAIINTMPSSTDGHIHGSGHNVFSIQQWSFL